MNIFEIINLRTRFEQIVNDGRYRYDLECYESDINNLEWFVEHAHKSNRFRKCYDEALQIAKIIISNR